MNVSDILDRVIELSVGQDAADTEEKLSFKKYLNMAGDELYRATAALDDRLHETYIAEQIDEKGEIELLDITEDPISLFRVNKVRSKEFPAFEQISDAALQEKKFIEDTSMPVFSLKDNKISFYSNGIKPYDAFISYVPEFTPFEYDPETGQGTLEKDIPFRKEWHPLLVYGTLYYIYQDMDGFKSSVKESVAASEWKNGIQRYSASLFNSFPSDFTPTTRV